MKFAENNRISHRQLYRQMILGLLAPFLLCIPGRNGMNGLSAVLGIVAAMVFFCFYVIILIRLTPAFDNLVKAAEGGGWQRFPEVCFPAGFCL